MSVSNEEKVAIITKFICAAPPHEMKDVLKAVRTLTADDDLFASAAQSACAQYNMENMVGVVHPDTKAVVLQTQHNAKGDSKFYDPVSGAVLVVDPVELTVLDVEQGTPDGSTARSELHDRVTSYFKAHFKTGAVNVFVTDGGLAVCITAEKSSPQNKWSGRWCSTYNVAMPTEDTAKVTGQLRCRVHYYEEGNIQMEGSHEVVQQVTGSGAADTLAKVAKVIEKGDREFQVKLDETTQTLGGTSLKALRRPLPVTKQLYDFSSHGMRLAKELSGAN
eukprot:PhM_4_TR351/c0_g1_i1/m.2964/K10364/CAPZA; capping protein (actin filament) muscle Z-line, alpha